MTWKAVEALEERNYRQTEERSAFLAGYSDGWYDYPMWSSNERSWYPSAYCAGYNTGLGDKA